MIDSSEIDRLAVDLAGAPQRMQLRARGTMKRAAVKIKADMREEFSGHRYSGGVPASLEFEQQGMYRFEVGELDSAGPQWGIAAILAYGTSNNAPVADHRASLRREVPFMLRALGKDAEASVLGGPS